MAKQYVSNEKETPRLFSNQWMEKLSHVHPSVPLILYVPLISYFLLFKNDIAALGVGSTFGLFVGGVLLWTFMEYVIHRFVFHYHPSSDLGQKVHFLVHGVHHDYPRDPMRLVMPPAVSIPLAIIFYSLFISLIGKLYTPAFYSGFVFGYLCYDMIHYATHHLSLRHSKIGLWLKHYHSLHHYQDETSRYGVSNPLWDYVFHTKPSGAGNPSQV